MKLREASYKLKTLSPSTCPKLVRFWPAFFASPLKVYRPKARNIAFFYPSQISNVETMALKMLAFSSLKYTAIFITSMDITRL